MARLARVILPGYPHHITQRGNRRQDVFFKEEDYRYYLDLLKYWCREEKLELCGDWKLYLKQSQKESDEQFERHTRTGRPLGDKTFIAKAEKLLNRDLRKKKPGPKVSDDN